MSALSVHTEAEEKRLSWGVGRTEPMTPNRVLQTGTIASLPKVKGLKKTILKSGGV